MINTDITIKRKEDTRKPSMSSLVNVFGNPLSLPVPTLSVKAEPYRWIQERIQDMDGMATFPDFVANDPKYLDLLFNFDPSIYWKQLFPVKHRANADYLKKALMIPDYKVSDFSLVPKSLRQDVHIFKWFLSHRYLECVMSYSEPFLLNEPNGIFFKQKHEISFDLWNSIHTKAFTYLDLDNVPRPETTDENHLMYSLCHDMKNRRELFHKLMMTRKDKIGIPRLLNMIPFEYLVLMDDFVNGWQAEEYGTVKYTDEISKIFRKVISKKKMLTPIRWMSKGMDKMLFFDNASAKIFERERHQEWQKLQLTSH